jgi:hypothetical protein
VPAVAGIPTAAAGADAELIALGKKYEILVDRYYAARAVWAPALSAAHIERDTAYEAELAIPHYERSPEKNAEMSAVFDARSKGTAPTKPTIGSMRSRRK